MSIIDESRIEIEKGILADNKEKAEQKLSAYEPAAAAQALTKAAEAADNLSELVAGTRGDNYGEQAELFRTEAAGFKEEGIDYLSDSNLYTPSQGTQQSGPAPSNQSSHQSSGSQRLQGGDTNGGDKTGKPTPSEADSETEVELSVETPEIDFSDVGGMEELKAEFREEIAYPVEKRDVYEQYGIEPIGGVMLQGPPGVGKTHITRALAGELGWSFIELRPSDIVSALFGESAKKVREVFNTARENAPCIVFFDEIDSIARDRAGAGNSTQSGEMLLTEFLQQANDIDGEVVIFAATNAPEQVDSAVMNADRIEKTIEVPLPDAAARKAILRVHLGNREVPVQDVDYDEIATAMDGFSGADVKAVAQSAARNAAQQADEQGQIIPITHENIQTAVEDRRESMDTEELGGYL